MYITKPIHTFHGTLQPYEQAELVNDWEKLSTMPAAEVAAIHNRWMEIFDDNLKIVKQNERLLQDKIDNVVQAMLRNGVDPYRSRARGTFYAWFTQEVVQEIRETYRLPEVNFQVPSLEQPDTQVVQGLRVEISHAPFSIVTVRHYVQDSLDYQRGAGKYARRQQALQDAIAAAV